MLTYQKGDEMGVARKRFWDSTGELSSWPRALGQITLSHYSPTSRTNHQEIGQCSQEGAWFMGISSNSHRWLIHQLLRKKVTSIVILPTQHSSKRPPKKIHKSKNPTKIILNWTFSDHFGGISMIESPNLAPLQHPRPFFSRTCPNGWHGWNRRWWRSEARWRWGVVRCG